jgi:phosphonate transport system permease protein
MNSSVSAARLPKPAFPLLGIGLAVLILAVVFSSFYYLAFNPLDLFTVRAMSSIGGFVGRFFPPDLSSGFITKVARGTLETLAISAIATLLAAVFGLLLALPAANRFGRPAQQAVRLILNFLRAKTKAIVLQMSESPVQACFPDLDPSEKSTGYG